jgi:hypothetical protein
MTIVTATASNRHPNLAASLASTAVRYRPTESVHASRGEPDVCPSRRQPIRDVDRDQRAPSSCASSSCSSHARTRAPAASTAPGTTARKASLPIRALRCSRWSSTPRAIRAGTARSLEKGCPGASRIAQLCRSPRMCSWTFGPMLPPWVLIRPVPTSPRRNTISQRTKLRHGHVLPSDGG